MALHDGKRVLKDSAGKLYKVDPAQADQTAKVKGWTDASADEVQARADVLAQNERYGGAGQTALATAEKVARTASFGLLDDGGESTDRAKVLEREQPALNFAAQAAGSTLPALATGGLAGAAGLGAAGVAAGEGLAAGAADELEQSAIEGRPVSVGNVLMFGLGGELAGRAVPALIRRGMRSLAPAADAVARVAGEAAEDLPLNSLKRAESRAAKEAAAMPEGPARAAAMAQTADQQIERTSVELADSLDTGSKLATQADEQVDKLADELVSEDAPAQMAWANDTSRALRDLTGAPMPAKQSVDDLSRAFNEATGLTPKASPADLTGKSLDDLGANSDPSTFKQETLEALRTGKGGHGDFAADFGTTGRVKQKGQLEQGLQVELGPDGPRLVDGRHRLMVGREKGLTEVHGQVYQGKRKPGGKPVYEGPIPIASKPAAAAAPGWHGAAQSLADDLLNVNGGAATFKRVRAGVRELEAAGAPPEATKLLRDGLKAKELWGQAAELEESVQKVQAKANGARQAVSAADAAGLRTHLEVGPSERGAAGAGINQAVESLEDIAQLAGKWNLLGKGPLGKLVKMSLKARRAIGDANLASAGKAAAGAGRRASSGVAGEVVETIADMALGHMGIPPIAGIAGKMLWGRIDESAKQAIKGAARRMVRPVYDEGLDSAKAIVTASALSRFQGDYSTPDQAFTARAKMLEQARLQPMSVPLALAQSTGDLHKTDPRLFQQLAARVASQFAYVNANLPVSMGVSMAYPRGVPPSRGQLADYAELWNSTFEPETVLDDLADGMASPMQMRVLRDVHPDIYQQVHEEVIFEVANSYAEVPTQRKQQLDILFESDGIAGPCFTWRCSDYIEEANDAASQRAASGPAPSQLAAAGESGIAPASINAIKNGVTNRGA